MSICYQSDLFGSMTRDAGLGDLRDARRTRLSAGAWVDALPNWLRGDHDVFERLAADVPWRADRRVMYDRTVEVPRLTCWFGEGEVLPHRILDEARAALSDRYLPELGEPLVTAGMCLYRDGQDSVAWHRDSLEGRHPRRTVVAIVSLGAPRTLSLRPVGGGSINRFQMAHGDLVVMGGTTQATWEHAVLKTAKESGPRISVQFRARGVF